MIRTDHILTFFGTAAAGLGLGALVLVLTLRPDPAPDRSALEAVTRDAATQNAPALSWPALFGEVPPTQTAADAPPQPTADYVLKGLVAAARGGWAIVTGPEGDQLVELGSTLADGAEVRAITPEGVEILRAGQTFLIGFAAPDAAPAPVAALPGGAPPQTARATLSLRQLREDGFQRTLGLAGGTQIVERGNGVLAQEIVWVRNGRFYDQIGLQQGDVLLTLNGIPAGDIEALTEAAPQLLRERSFAVEILRAGSRMTLEVIVDEDL